ncbi:MAG: hypothetical protein WKG00_02990 [Polyangiaceae bacterium]
MRAAKVRALLLLLLSGICLVGCGSDEPAGAGGSGASGASGGASSSGGAGGGSDPVPCDGAPATLSLGGTWAAIARLKVQLEGSPDGAVSLCPEEQHGDAELLLMVHMVEDPTDPTQLPEVTAALCDLSLPIVKAKVGDCAVGDQNLVSTEIIAPPALLAGLPSVPSSPATAALGGSAPGASLTVQGLKMTVGSTKSGAEMPAWDVGDSACNGDDIGRTNACEETCVSDCAALRDDDGDGYPGVTVHVCGYVKGEEPSACNADDPASTGVSLQGKAFMDIEVAPVLDGEAVSSCELAGKVATPIAYNLVGADIWIGPGPIGVSSGIKSLPLFDVDPEASRFRMVRIDGAFGAPDWDVDAADAAGACAVIVSRANQLL